MWRRNRAGQMRLSQAQRKAVVQTVAEACGPQARVRLFGSRLDDTLRGGDVDLLVELPDEPADIHALQRQLYVRLLRALDGRALDVLVVGPHTPRHPVHEAALREGRLL
jgi:predicted nucleotidyltransferase